MCQYICVDMNNTNRFGHWVQTFEKVWLDTQYILAGPKFPPNNFSQTEKPLP